jgi:hypothetical protein
MKPLAGSADPAIPWDQTTEGGVRSLLQFLWVSGAVIVLTAGTIFAALWAISFGDGRGERVASSLSWPMFWPLVWFYRWLTGKDTGALRHRDAPSAALIPASEVHGRKQGVRRFRSVREAKEYLAGMIVEEANRNGAPLTEVERKMIYFTETGWTLPDMKGVSAEFDRDYDQAEYEQRIASTVGKVQDSLAADGRQEERANWARALEKLGEGDHYLLVLIGAAGRTRKGARQTFMKLALVLVFLAFIAIDAWFWGWLRNH